MRLVLSSAAAPDFTLDELFAACALRGLAGLELVQGDAHGLHAGSTEAEVATALRRAAEHGVAIVAFRAADAEGVRRAAPLARMLRAPVVAPPGALSATEAGAAIEHYRGEGAQLLLAHGNEPDDAWQLRRVITDALGGAALAWDAAPAPGQPIDAQGILDAAGDDLRHIRLLGGGPEAAAQAGLGIGELAMRLAIRGYAGGLALAPSTPRFLTAWRFWLGRRGWGCGSKESLSTLGSGASA